MNDIYSYDIQWILSVDRKTADNSPYTNISPQKYSISEIFGVNYLFWSNIFTIVCSISIYIFKSEYFYNFIKAYFLPF